MGRLQTALLAFPLFAICSCSETDPPGSFWEIEVTLRTAHTPRVGENVTIICDYTVVYPTDSVRTWHPQGRIFFSSYDWSYVSGDTIWHDTVQTLHKGTHQIVLRPVRYDVLSVDAEVNAPPASSFIDTLSGHDVLMVHSRLTWP